MVMNFLVPKGIPHHGRCSAGTRKIHAFGGKRIQTDCNLKV